MSDYYHLEWQLEGYILLATIPQTIPESEHDALDQAFLDHLNQTKGDSLHLIFNLSAHVRMPDIRRMQDLKFVHDSRVGWILVVGNINPVAKFLIGTMAKVNRSKFRIFDSVSEAITFVQAVDKALPMPESVT